MDIAIDDWYYTDRLRDAHDRYLDKLLEGLTADQRDAVTHEGSPLLILAGAGTGKTRVLTTRIAWLISTGRAQPENILAMTFTNKAAREMSRRIAELTGDTGAITATTFHSFAARVLREFGGSMGWTTDWTILDSDDSRRMLRKAWTATCSTPPEKEKINQLDQMNQTIKKEADPISAFYNIPEQDRRVLESYENLKRNTNTRDFSDIISDLQLLFQEDPASLYTIIDRYTHILVDEYQDTDAQQDQIVNIINDRRPNLTVVGDEDQLLYSWRHANIHNILGFATRHQARTIRLQDNFRSTDQILKVANRLIAHNQSRLGKQLTPTIRGGQPVRHAACKTHTQEAIWIADRIQESIALGTNPEEHAILARATHALNMIERIFTERGIRYTLSGGHRFQDRQEIRDIAAYIRLTVNAHDKPAFERAISIPKRGVGASIIENIEHVAKEHMTDMLTAAERMAIGQFMPEETASQVLAFAALIRDTSARLLFGMDAATAIQHILDRTGYLAALRQDIQDAIQHNDNERRETTENRIHNLQDLVEIGRGRTAEELLDHLGFSEDARRQDGKGVWIGTIHAAKGLEFQHVYLPAWEEGILPSRQALTSEQIEEERRIAYVAITRARTTLHITSAEQRFDEPTVPSRFLHELAGRRPGPTGTPRP